MNEIFSIIPGFPDYLIGDLGTVKSLKWGRNRTLKPSIDKDGYLYVGFWDNSEKKTFFVHRLVAIHFIPNPDNLPDVNHLDGDKLNCTKSNLAWTTVAENNQHAYDTGLKVGLKGAKNPNTNLTAEDVENIRSLRGKKTQGEIAIMFGIAPTTVCNIQNGKRWQSN